jgi:hypothetical protein
MHSANMARLTQGRAAHDTPGPKPVVAKATRAGTTWHPIGTG